MTDVAATLGGVVRRWSPGGVTCGTDVAAGVWGPRDAVDARAVVVEASDGRARNSHVQDDHLDQRIRYWTRQRHQHGL